MGIFWLLSKRREECCSRGWKDGREKTVSTHGEESSSEIGHKGDQKLRKLIREGKKHEKNKHLKHNSCFLFSSILFLNFSLEVKDNE